MNQYVIIIGLTCASPNCPQDDKIEDLLIKEVHHFIAYKVLGLVMLRSICLKRAHVWPPGEQPTNPRRRSKELLLVRPSRKQEGPRSHSKILLMMMYLRRSNKIWPCFLIPISIPSFHTLTWDRHRNTTSVLQLFDTSCLDPMWGQLVFKADQESAV